MAERRESENVKRLKERHQETERRMFSTNSDERKGTVADLKRNGGRKRKIETGRFAMITTKRGSDTNTVHMFIFPLGYHDPLS